MSSEAQGKRVALLLAVVTFQPREGRGAREWEPSRQPCQRLGVFENCSFEDQGKGLEITVGNGALVGVTEDAERLEIQDLRVRVSRKAERSVHFLCPGSKSVSSIVTLGLSRQNVY